MTTGPAGNIDVVMTLDDQATPKLTGFTAAVKQNQTAVSDLAMGATFMGTAFLGMGAAMAEADNVMISSIGNMMSMVGGVMAFVGSTTMFIFAVSKMVESLKQLALWQTITKALSGPKGWAMLAVGAAVAGAGIYTVSQLSGGAKAKAAAGGGDTTINVNVAGSVKTERDLVDGIQEGLALKGDRNAGRVLD